MKQKRNWKSFINYIVYADEEANRQENFVSQLVSRTWG